MIVGIDVHKRTHAVALLDERGGEVATTAVANSPEGFRRLIGWLSDHEAGEAVVGVESPGSYGRCLVGALAAAGHEVLHVPAWRTHRERHRQGPGKTDPGDAISIAQVVLRKREELGPALEPELVRALSTLELQRRRFVRDRTQAIQRLRADWTQVDPVAEGRVLRLDRDRELRGLKRISFGDGLAEQTPPAASASSPATSRTSTAGSPPSTQRSLSCSPNTRTRSRSCTGRAPTSPPRSSPRPATFGASGAPGPSPASAGRHRSPAAQARPPGAIGCIGAATDSSTPPSIGSRSSRPATTPKPSATSLARSPRERPNERRDERSSDTSPTSSTDVC